MATLDSMKAIERYFYARGSDDPQRLFFERRTNQYSKQDIPAIRVFDIRLIARCVGAMFFDKPDFASRYPTKLTSELRDIVFQKNYQEEIYYTAANAYYRLNLHFSNNRIEPRLGKFRWHILMAVRTFVSHKSVRLNSTKIVDECKNIDEFFNRTDEIGIKKIKELCDYLGFSDDISRDRIKGQAFVQEIKGNAAKMRDDAKKMTGRKMAKK